MIERHEGQLTSHQEFYKLEDSGEFFHVTEKRKKQNKNKNPCQSKFFPQLFSKNSSKINTRSDKCKQINLTLKMKWIKDLINQSFPKKK